MIQYGWLKQKLLEDCDKNGLRGKDITRNKKVLVEFLDGHYINIVASWVLYMDIIQTQNYKVT